MTSDTSTPKTTAERSRKAREKRRRRGEAQIIAWVPSEKIAYARELLKRVLAGSNTLPPDPEQAATVADLQARIVTLDTALAVAREDLNAARSRADLDARLLADAQASVDRAIADLVAEQTVTRRYRRPGWRGRLIDLLARD